MDKTTGKIVFGKRCGCVLMSLVVKRWPYVCLLYKKIRYFYPQSVKRHINKNEILTTDIQYYNTLFNKHKDFY